MVIFYIAMLILTLIPAVSVWTSSYRSTGACLLMGGLVAYQVFALVFFGIGVN